jgi:hypothetical protein
VAGANRQGTIGDCYTIVTVTAAAGSSQLGGLVGYNYLGPIVTCYAAGTVQGADGVERTGGLVGHADELTPTANCFFLAPQTGDGGIGIGLPLTAQQMTQSASFTDWDFAKTWMICEGQTYPRLLWEQTECEP